MMNMYFFILITLMSVVVVLGLISYKDFIDKFDKNNTIDNDKILKQCL